MKIELENENFNELIKEELVVVDFYADWCGPCKMLSPIIDEVTDDLNVKLVKVNVDKHNMLAKEYGIMSIPTIILFKNGELKEKRIGMTSHDELVKWIEENK